MDKSKDHSPSYSWEKEIIHGTYFPHIDGIRALAIIPVLLYHLADFFCPGGFAGVDVFFVISGYLITKGILKDLHSGDFTIGNFYRKRIRRVFPAYCAMILLVISAGICLFYAPPLKELAESAMASALYIANMFFALTGTGYFATDAQHAPLENLWSLSVEEQFYIFIPLLAMILWKLKPQWLKGIFWGIAVISFSGAVYLVHRGDTNSAFYHLPWRMWELLAGALLSFHPLPGKRKPFHQWLSCLGGVLILGTYLFCSRGVPFPGLTALPCVIGTLLLIHFSRSTAVGKCLSWRPIVFIGKISYSLYLFHWPVIVFWKYCVYQDSLLMTQSTAFDYCGMTVLSFALAYLSWKYVEVPCRLFKWTKRQAFAFALSGMFVICLICSVIISTDGFKDELHRQANASSSPIFRPKGVLIEEKYLKLKKLLGCQSHAPLLHVGDTAYPPSFILIGDSHAGHLVDGFNELGKENGFSCYVFWMPNAHSVNAEFREIIQMLTKRPDIKTVIFSYYWNHPSHSEIDFKKLTDLCRFFKSLGRELYIIGDCPDWHDGKWNYSQGPSNLYAKSLMIPMPYPKETPWFKKTSEFDVLHRSVEKLQQFGGLENVTVIPLHQAFLQGDYYTSLDPATRAGFYSDYHHLSPAGSIKAAKYIYPFIKKSLPTTTD